ncbi:MAG: lamin tail domain-containing protein [Bacteroidales bacterium]|jgi:hypothetical protein|nr:lamin tail domain-containing protein [Bacteroidales bacterium]
MKKVILMSLMLLSLCTSAQVCHTFEEATTEGWTFSLPDSWRADSVKPLIGSYSLHHSWDNIESSADAATFSISGLCPECAPVMWQFTIRHGTDPSSSNRWSFILMSDAGASEIISGSGYNGFAVGVNATGYDDTLRMWHITGGKAEVVVTTGINWQADVGVDEAMTIIVRRSEAGEWRVEVGEQGAGSWGQGAWSGTEQKLYVPRYAGIVYTYTATRDRLLWLDDVCVSGTYIADTLPPGIISVAALSPDMLQLMLDEEPDGSFTEEGNISIGSDNKIIKISRISPAAYVLHLAKKIRNRETATIKFGSLCDLTGNCTPGKEFSFVPYYAVTGDVVVSEIMADPSPPVRLPECEYLEITNRTGDRLFTGGWHLIADSDSATLPDRWLKPGEIVILCSASKTSLFKGQGEVLGLSSFPTLNDGGETIALRDATGSLIHAVPFTPAFYNDGYRSGGGWSAEMTDMSNPFNTPEAWRASVDPSGGTPGRANSVVAVTDDNDCPEIIAAWPLSVELVRVLFSETVITEREEGWLTGGERTMPPLSDDIADRAWLVPLDDELEAGAIYTLSVPATVSDFAGNVPCTTDVKIGLPVTPAAGEILFNELLFDPLPGCDDYAELYNNSGRIFSLSELSLANGSSAAATRVSEIPRLLFPGEYMALTTARKALLDNYHCSDRSFVHEVLLLPSMPDDKGSLVLLNSEMTILDRVDYHSSMHLSFLSGTEGISLEKVAPGLPSDISSNWHSASEVCGWGTPGTENSVSLCFVDEKSGMNLSSGRISPDGDGFEDVISVDIFPGGDDNMITVTLFTDRGRMVRRLAERFSAGRGARFVWDGTDDYGGRVPAGLYIIIGESFNPNGKTQRWKEVCALLYR